MISMLYFSIHLKSLSARDLHCFFVFFKDFGMTIQQEFIIKINLTV